jgi:N-acetylglucosamine-6-sulfatase
MSRRTAHDPIRARPGVSSRLAIAAALVVCLGSAAALSQSASSARAAGPQPHPNIVVITTDDQSLAMLSREYMPQTFRLVAERGSTFFNAIATTPLCCPSRASLLTGQYAHNHGVTANHYGLLEDKDNLLPVWLRRAGYRTAHVGKFLNAYERTVPDKFEVAPGWDAWFTTLGATRYFNYEVSANGRRIHFGRGRRSHVTRVINRKAATLVRRYTADSMPLYLQLDHRAPHAETGVDSGGRCGARAVPEIPSDQQRFSDEPLPITPSFNEADVSDKPSYIQARTPLTGPQIKKIGKRFDCAVAALRSVDRGVKAIVEALKQTRELNNTVLIFTSDNGYYFGEHRIAKDKTHPYEEGIRVPLLMRVPSRYLGGRPAVSQIHEQVGNIDLAPTLLGLADGQPCAGDGDCRVMDGRSLMPLLRGEGGFPSERGLLIEYDGASSKGTSSCKYAAIRAAGRIYVEHDAIPDPVTGVCHESEETEFYDLTVDPFQLQSLAPDGDPVAEWLRSRLDRLRHCSGVEGRDPPPADRRPAGLPPTQLPPTDPAGSDPPPTDSEPPPPVSEHCE